MNTDSQKIYYCYLNSLNPRGTTGAWRATKTGNSQTEAGGSLSTHRLCAPAKGTCVAKSFELILCQWHYINVYLFFSKVKEVQTDVRKFQYQKVWEIKKVHSSLKSWIYIVVVKLLNAVSILSAYYNKQACSPPPWDTQSLAGYYPSAFRSWKSAFISQRAGPSDSAALYLLSSGQRRRQFSSVWISPPGHTKAWGGGAINDSSFNWQRAAYLVFLIFLALIPCRFWILLLVNKCLKSKGCRFEHVRHIGSLHDAAPRPLVHPGVSASHLFERLVNTRLPKEVITLLLSGHVTDYILKCCRIKSALQNCIKLLLQL